MSNKGDFTYNGVPIFNVGFMDFTMFAACIESKSRIFSKSIISDDVRDYYKKSRDKKFGVCYEGVMLDIRKIKECDN
jgi:hypothetical protein